MMFRPYIFAFSALFLGVSSELAASDWTKAKNQFRTELGVNQTNNLFNSIISFKNRFLYSSELSDFQQAVNKKDQSI